MNLDKITQKYFELFPGDFSGNPMQRQTPKVLFSTVEPADFPNSKLLIFNEELSAEIGLGSFTPKDLDFLSATNLPENIRPYATAYAGHQFGNWAGQLGDGRAIFAGEITDNSGKPTEIQWKGAGATPYSRHADGRAVLRSSLREYLCSEAMYHLGVPTTRALSLVLSGENVVRDLLYDGHPAQEPGAVVVRTAESFLRFGHFELLSAQKEIPALRALADFSIENYFPEISSEGNEKYKDFFKNICERTALLMVDWYRTGFVHGVMNTDNMSILGLTIDYGPFSFLDEYDLNFTPNTTDLPGRRYAFGKQAQIAQWNLWQLANALFPLIDDERFLEQTLDGFSEFFWQKHDEMMCRKFGLDAYLEGDAEFFSGWQDMMQKHRIDYTLFFVKLDNFNENLDAEAQFSECFYEMNKDAVVDLREFLQKYSARLQRNASLSQNIDLMQKSNPKFILRNYLLYECIAEIERGSRTLLDQILEAIRHPYEVVFPEFSAKRPRKYDGMPGCSMLSCSS